MIIMIINIDSLLCIDKKMYRNPNQNSDANFPTLRCSIYSFFLFSTLGYRGLFHSPSGSNRHHQTGKQIEGCLVEPFADFDSHRIHGDRYFENGFWFGSCNQVCG
uniref:Uncharacterized protein n=1 Tax=Cacopsylla melanoneura TaxID=428564 RepID=A0A8D8WWV7_9HEMI